MKKIIFSQKCLFPTLQRKLAKLKEDNQKVERIPISKILKMCLPLMVALFLFSLVLRKDTPQIFPFKNICNLLRVCEKMLQFKMQSPSPRPPAGLARPRPPQASSNFVLNYNWIRVNRNSVIRNSGIWDSAIRNQFRVPDPRIPNLRNVKVM